MPYEQSSDVGIEVDMSCHDRYLIYNLLGHQVSFDLKKRKKIRRLVGVVERVCRNIFQNAVELTVSGKTHIFDEPAAIIQSGPHLMFVYGTLQPFDLGDDALFAEMRDTGRAGETVDDVIRRTTPTKSSTLKFHVGERVLRPRKTWRKSSVSCN